MQGLVNAVINLCSETSKDGVQATYLQIGLRDIREER